ncbi:glycoside hydrolase family 71/99 protein [Pedobacter psychroterrae]|uniref:Glycosyl hydrolase family 71 n=1 Tax=Pedobacter psychroterrae TaxID=2530453 RepID=A0A4V6N612_9SPHI|nr:hypothetical protein [Pedobacter psychroterrae]TCD00977.1 hypothetical protein EZ437_09395 [Pedobacter psychroterrae]
MKSLVLALLLSAQGLVVYAQADTWVATDALGRKVLPEGKGIKKDRYVGIFYFIWQGAHGYDLNNGTNATGGVKDKTPADTISPYDISKMLAKNPLKPEYGPIHAFHHWGEPYFGYYLSDDEWVIRKHGQMLGDAGIDVLILDVTNASIYLPQVTKIVETFRSMRKQGIKVPNISFIVNSAPAQTVQRLYEYIYQKELFKDFWFYWKGKPLLLCPPEALTPEMKTFFSSRQSWAWSKDQKWFGDGKDKWTWLDHTPQSYGWHEDKNKPEQISVAVAEHPMSNIGRSFHDGKEPDLKQPEKGLYFAEQWKRALEVDPEFVFITGWNEWIAMRFDDGASAYFLGKKIPKGETYFVDLYNDEYSRDAEPVMGAFNDNYYYQMVANIRKFKGTLPGTVYHKTNKIRIDGNFADWANTEVVFADDPGDTFHRKHAGWGRIKEYTNNTGRNDIIESRITSDDANVYFYVKTKGELTSWTDKDWMQLYLSIGESNLPRWEGFQFLINGKPKSRIATDIQVYKGGKWSGLGTIGMNSKGNELELVVPKKLLGIKGKQFTIDFKWSDNSPALENVMNWLDNGDTAPNARFAYRYIKQ